MKFFKTNKSEVYNRFLKINNNYYNNIIKDNIKKEIDYFIPLQIL